jgi:hypothetical protein
MPIATNIESIMKAFVMLWFIVISSGFSAPRCWAAIYHSDGTSSNIQSIHDNQAQDGDTITLPAGTFTWTTTVNCSKAITIQGATTIPDDTNWLADYSDSVAYVVNDAVKSGDTFYRCIAPTTGHAPPNASFWAGLANDATILVDNIGNRNFARLFAVALAPDKPLTRITGITFKGGSTVQGYNGIVSFTNSSSDAVYNVRLDHCHFDGVYNLQNTSWGGNKVYGVSDHCIIDNTPAQAMQNSVNNGGGYGDAAFTQSANYGSRDFMFFENWWINNWHNGPTSASGGWDARYGAAYVIRYSHLYNVEILCHGTEDGRARGGRAMEIYNNDYHWSGVTSMDGIRSGTFIAHDNTHAGSKPLGYAGGMYRAFASQFSGQLFGNADGTNNWDVNATEPDGSHVDGHPPYVFTSGTVTSGSSSSLTDTSQTWTPHQFQSLNGNGGYIARRVSDGKMALVLDNTSNTLNMYFYDAAFTPIWAAGNQYAVRKVNIVLDQNGRGAGDLVTGDTPTPAWPHNVIEGMYSWNNTYPADGTHINFNPPPYSTPFLREGRDYFSDTPLPGYTPYVYPHPLVSGDGGPPPGAPRNLRIVP